jgi:hypothetical protein
MWKSILMIKSARGGFCTITNLVTQEADVAGPGLGYRRQMVLRETFVGVDNCLYSFFLLIDSRTCLPP